MFVNQAQYYPYALLGAPGCWSIDSWMGPWPLLRLRNAVAEGDHETARQITSELLSFGGPGGPPDLRWRETAAKVAQGFAGYVKPGPLRPPFVNVPETVVEGAKRRAAAWNAMCARYRPQVEALAAV